MVHILVLLKVFILIQEIQLYSDPLDEKIFVGALGEMRYDYACRKMRSGAPGIILLAMTEAVNINKI